MISDEELARIFIDAYRGREWPAPLKRQTGEEAALLKRIRSVREEPIPEADLARIKRTMGSLVNGQAAERAFERIYSAEMQTSEVRLIDDRTQRTDADYILLNGEGKPLYRLNIKLHGSLFRKAKEHVGLEPPDCFPLATYKIFSALQKQDQHHLPYLFVVVTVPGLTAEKTGAELPPPVTEGVLVAKRVINTRLREAEELFIDACRLQNRDLFAKIDREFEGGHWYIFSARRAHLMMKELLFERVFALRQRNFNRAFKNAEIDLHLSFSRDMLPVKEFLEKSRQLSAAQLYSMIERGTI
jgi:hypothetical protein